MTTLKDFLISFGVAALAGSSLFVSLTVAANPSNFRYSMTPSTIEAGERTTLEIRLPKSAQVQSLPRVDDSLLTQAQPFILLHSEQKEEENEFVWLYDVTSYKTGDFPIPPFLVHYGPNTFSTERTQVTVTSHRSEADADLRDDFPKIWPPIQWKKMTGVFLVAIFTLVVGIYLERKLRAVPWHKFKRPLAIAPTPPSIDPLIWLKQELTRIRNQIETGGGQPAYADELTYILKKYLHLKYHEPFTSKTTLEFKQRIPQFNSLAPLLEPFQRLDQYKFAPQKREDPKVLVLGAIQIAEKTLCGT